ncbi:Protein CBG26943 [Caenorhabditis briggsae]|uniref:Protein CBG26943 n=1 Tax=Caenorhabditis briggsae TaxID=6238 RepID=B6IHT6_CAEBR|nr:Protein CBG26943 [Caenorhabditis briggsae]CAR99466.1 Protein CBG26943 [Caenorhabditis briggsae]
MKVDLHPQLPAVLTVLLDISGTVDVFTNSLVVYLVIFKSPALKRFRYYLLYSQLNTAVVDVYLAFLMKPVPIFPAMGGYTTGILATWFGISSHVQMTIMIFNMGMQAVAIFQTFLAKHQAIVSIDRRRVLRKLFYWRLVGIGFFLTIVTIWLYYLGDISKEQQIEYIRKNIPNLEQILMSNPSLDIYD